MGVNFSKCGYATLGVKRLRTGYLKTDCTLNNAETADQTSPFAYSVWQNLTFEVLVEIYRYLPNNDKLNMSLTCKSWSQPFSRPEVWRKVTFLFNGKDDRRALLFPKSLMSGLRHLYIDCPESTPLTSYGENRKTTFKLCTFLDRCKNCKLVTLQVTRMDRLTMWFQCSRQHDIARVLGELLPNQTNLKVLNLAVARFNSQQGTKLLNIIATLGPTITFLELGEFFFCQRPINIANHLRSFTKLTDLTISDPNLSEALLNVIADSTPLEKLNVFFEMSSQVSLPSKEAWERLKKTRPALEVSYVILYTSSGQLKDLKKILTPGIPLATLDFKWSDAHHLWPLMCQHIAYNFQNHLRYLGIAIMSPLVTVDCFIDVIIENCLLLEKISITDVYGYNAPLLEPIKKSVRKARANHPESHLVTFIVNNVQEDLCVPFVRSVADWISDHIPVLGMKS